MRCFGPDIPADRRFHLPRVLWIGYLSMAPRHPTGSHRIPSYLTNPFRNNPGHSRLIWSIPLLVDDDTVVRAGLEAMLEGLGYRVAAASGGPAALTLLRNGTAIDALVTDYAMPGMNGAELVEEVRRLYRDLPVLLITGYAEKPTGFEQMPVLQKPFRPSELAESLGNLMKTGRAGNVAPFTSGRR